MSLEERKFTRQQEVMSYLIDAMDNPKLVEKLCTYSVYKSQDFFGYGIAFHTESIPATLPSHKLVYPLVEIEPNSPAYEAGMRNDQRVVAVNGGYVNKEFRTLEDFVQAIEDSYYTRNFTDITVIDPELWHDCMENPSYAAELAKPTRDTPTTYDKAKPRVCRLTRISRGDQYGFDFKTLKNEGRHVVNNVRAGLPADRAGLCDGDNILEVNGESVIGMDRQAVVNRISPNPTQVDLLVVGDWHQGYLTNQKQNKNASSSLTTLVPPTATSGVNNLKSILADIIRLTAPTTTTTKKINLTNQKQKQPHSSYHDNIAIDLRPPAIVGGLIGQLINGRYRIKRKIGEGGFGKVYLTLDQNDGLEKAIKIIQKFDAKNNAAREYNKLAEEELVMMRHLRHINVVKYFEDFTMNVFDSDHFVVLTEFCEKGDLKSQIQNYSERSKSIADSKICRWMIEASLGLEYLHSTNIIHRDIKPENILLNQNAEIKLADLGLSKYIETNVSKSKVLFSGLYGTACYYSPEQIRCEMRGGFYTNKIDIWALGCVLFELINLRLAFPGGQLSDNPAIPTSKSSCFVKILKE